MVLEEVTGMPYLQFIRDMFHSLKVGEIMDMDCSKELEKENIHLKTPFHSVSSGILCHVENQSETVLK